MSTQIEAPKDVPCKGITLSTEDRKNLECWYEEDGWCSACGVGARWHDDRDNIEVVHIGSRFKKVDVALCRVCVTRMHAALPNGVTPDKE